MRVVRLFRLLAVVIALTGLTIIGRPYAHGLSFVVRAADLSGTIRQLADLDTNAITERTITIPAASGSMRGRVYAPSGTSTRTTLLVSGLHPSGIDEPRLVKLARQLASSRLTVVTPDIPQLSRFEVTPEITTAIERTAAWLAADATLSGGKPIGLMGISFSGGLSLVAAGRPSLADHVAFVFSFGGHDDLPRVLRYLCTGAEPNPPGRLPLNGASSPSYTIAPHDYGVAVILLALAPRVVPAAQAESLREMVRSYLYASALDGGVDRSAAPAAFADLTARAEKLPEPSRTLMRYVLARDVVHLGARLLPYVNSTASDPALSLSKSPKPSARVFLLHGGEDNVIPSIESEYVADDLRGHAPVRLLLSGLISHADADRPVHAGDVLELASFWGDLLSR